MGRARVGVKKATRQIRREYVMNPAKGLNKLVSDSLIDKREASSLLNISFEESGVIKKRDGFSPYGTSLTTPQMISYYYNETNKELLTVDGGQPKKLLAGIWTNIPGVTMSLTRPFIDATQAKNKVYMWDAENGGVEYDGTTTSRPGTIPKAKFSIYNNGLHIASGVPGQPSRVYFAAGGKPSIFTRDATGKPSGAAAGDGWPDNTTDVPGATVFTGTAAAFTIDFGKDDGFAITGIAIFQGDIVVFKENAIYQLSFAGSTVDATAATVTLITKSIGCVSHRTIAYVENDIYFLTRRGVFVLGNEANFYTAVRTNELTARIRPLIDQILPAGYERCNAVYHKDRYLLAAPVASATVNRVLNYDRRYQAWSVWDSIAPRDMQVFIDNDNVEHFFFIQDSVSGGVKEQISGQYNDEGVAISAYWESAALDGDSIDITKRFVDLGVVLRQLNGILNIVIYADGQEILKDTTISGISGSGYGADMIGDSWIGGNIATTATTELGITNQPWRMVVKRNSRTLKFRVENNRIDESFALLGFILGYYPYSYYRFDSDRKVY